MARNSLAGKTPSYDKLNMSAASRKRKLEYDKKYQKQDKIRKYQSELHKANYVAKKKGTAKVGDGRDFSHTKSGKLTQVSQSKNRSFNGRGSRSKHHA